MPKFMKSRPLGTERETSTIPRVEGLAGERGGRPANNEQETGTSGTGKWIYPSEQMFFNAMKRKSYDPATDDMRTIVPIHNAVNEKAWAEIREWERGKGGERCGGPRLQSFSGTATALTPKARLNTLLGYHAPFDRHDWVVDRCGTRIDYVIDFYGGRDEGTGKSLNFYLDVRPKLNTWEGCKLRMGKFIGLS
ncbi:MAG: Cytochrome c1 heme lyase [Sclerophora amabilis]|nr:MAG: Cytochrome c1 heme lyase [Sclerophora amabilis]